MTFYIVSLTLYCSLVHVHWARERNEIINMELDVIEIVLEAKIGGVGGDALNS